jgi:hypothetical protein
VADPADPFKALLAWLAADARVAAMAGAWIYTGELPGAAVPAMPRQVLVIQPSGGVSLTGRSFALHDTQRFDLFAYGKTPIEADALRRACAIRLRALQSQLLTGCLIHWVQPAGGFALERDPQGGWPRAFQSFQVFHALEAAS